MSKFEIDFVKRETDPIDIDGVMQGLYLVRYKVRMNKKLTMTREIAVWASDELEAYTKAKHEIQSKTN